MAAQRQSKKRKSRKKYNALTPFILRYIKVIFHDNTYILSTTYLFVLYLKLSEVADNSCENLANIQHNEIFPAEWTHIPDIPDKKINTLTEKITKKVTDLSGCNSTFNCNKLCYI